MAINAYATHAVLREAKVVLMGPEAIRGLVRRLSGHVPSAAERTLVYDTLQYIAVSKRDFHQNHYLLTRDLLEAWGVPAEARHPLPADYLARLAAAPPATRALCQALILSGFVLDGQLSWRELRRLERAAPPRHPSRGPGEREAPAPPVPAGRRAAPRRPARLTAQ